MRARSSTCAPSSCLIQNCESVVPAALSGDPGFALSRDLLVVERRQVRAAAGVLDRDRADVPRLVEVNLRVLIEVLRLRHGNRPELDVERAGIVEIFELR